MLKSDYQPVTMTVQSRGQVTLPKRMRRAMNLEPGDTVIAVPDGDGTYRLEPLKRMSMDEIFARWGDPTPTTVEEVERQIQVAREAYADELAKEYGE
jgi:AbrB family looped-hinge helix DNA binding protein